MKAQFRSLLLAAAAVVAFAADEPSLGGEWQIQRSAGGHQTKQTCTLTQKGSELTGNCNAERGPVKISGKVEGKNVTLTYKSEHDGSPLTVIYRGAVESPGKITGTVTAVEFGIEGEFTATRSE